MAADNAYLKRKLELGEKVLAIKWKAHGNLMAQHTELNERFDGQQRDFESAKEALAAKDGVLEGLLAEKANCDTIGKATWFQRDRWGGRELEMMAGQKESSEREVEAVKARTEKLEEEFYMVKLDLELELSLAERQIELLKAQLERELEARSAAEQQHLLELAKLKKELEDLKTKDTSSIATQTTNIETSAFTTQTKISAASTATQTEVEFVTFATQTEGGTTTTTYTQTEVKKNVLSKMSIWYKKVCSKVSAVFPGLKKR
ncbi:hypothetical protein HDU76_002650 [Blyttiomyces sp. JEL0837]|nr:hypothetical protein HDU76_002650 [Blyttiomyces sp. JEL0837]